MKIVTLCGSMRFQKEMRKITQKLEIDEGYLVIQCVYFDSDDTISEEARKKLGEIHYKKIEMSDVIYVINVNGYIGDATKKEIEYAKSLQKEILSLEPF